MPRFTKQWQDLGFDDDALRGLQNIIMDDPEAGDIIRGAGGVRKLRFAFVGSGKSGSSRVCYVDFAVYETEKMTLYEELKKGLESGIEAYRNGTELKKTVINEPSESIIKKQEQSLKEN